MKKLILLIIFSNCITAGFAQNKFQFSTGGNGDELCRKLLIAHNGFYLAGQTNSFGSGGYDICVLKTDTLGHLVQSHVYGSWGEDKATSIADAGNKNIFLCGHTSSFGNEKPFVMKVDSIGQILFSAYYNLDGTAWDMVSLPDRSAVITGNTGTVESDIFLLKVDSLGQVLWAQSYGDSLVNQGLKVISTADSGFLIAGYTHIVEGGPPDFAVIKTDSLGNNLWMKRYDVNDWDMAFTIAEIGTDILVSGISYTDVFNNSPNSADGLVLLLSETGDIKNSFVIGSSGFDQIRDLVVHPNGQFTIVGTTDSDGNGKTDVLIMTLDTTGAIINQTLFGGYSFEVPHTVRAVSGNNRFIVSGYSESYGDSTNNIYFLRTSFLDSISCNQNVVSLSSVPVTVSVVDVMTSSSIVCTSNTASFESSVPPMILKEVCPKPISMIEVAAEEIIKIFPNPAYDILNVTSETNTIEHIEIFSLSGKKMVEQRMSGNTISIPVDRMSPGIYFSKITFYDGQFAMRKIQIIR